MDISPQDLGEARRARVKTPEAQRASPAPPVAALLVLAGVLLFLLSGGGGVAHLTLLILTGLGLKLLLAASFSWRRQRQASAALTPWQVQGLIAKARDPLEREFLGAVLAALRMPPLPDAAAAEEVRRALRALGAAIEALPATPALPQSAAKLDGWASSLRDEAAREPDPVVAATLRRRAETRQRQAQTASLVETLARRNAALRQELSDQLDSLQTSLAAFRVGGAWSVQEMADVAAGIQWVAIEANALAAAQVELGDALHAPRVPNPAYSGPDGTRQRLQGYIADDTE